jgi:hypothetical protein
MAKSPSNKKVREVLEKHLGKKVKFQKRWEQTFKPSKWATGRPEGLVTHHTAGAAGDSTDPNHKTNQPGANAGQIKFVENHPSYSMPCSQFALDRDGTVFVNCLSPCYHAGKSDPSTWIGSDYQKLSKCGTDAGNSYYMGVECVSKGLKKDFTQPMKESLGKLIAALEEAYGWDKMELRHLNHKTYAGPRKSDTKYPDSTIHDWYLKYGGGYWDGKVPSLEGVLKAEAEGIANPQAWRLACRLADLGYYKGEPQERGVQKYPAKAVANANAKYEGMEDPTKYGPKLHERLFG